MTWVDYRFQKGQEKPHVHTWSTWDFTQVQGHPNRAFKALICIFPIRLQSFSKIHRSPMTLTVPSHFFVSHTPRLNPALTLFMWRYPATSLLNLTFINHVNHTVFWNCRDKKIAPEFMLIKVLHKGKH